MNGYYEKTIVWLARSFGLWFLLSFIISIIPLFLFTISSNTENMDTDRLIEGINLWAEWIKCLAMSQVQILSIIGTIIINLAYESRKSNQSYF